MYITLKKASIQIFLIYNIISQQALRVGIACQNT